jgi:hypothetical protein
VVAELYDVRLCPKDHPPLTLRELPRATHRSMLPILTITLGKLP